MIVVDTSALIALLLNEPTADAIEAILGRSSGLTISAGTLTEFLVVATGRGLIPSARSLLDSLAMTVEPVTHDRALQAASAYAKWGKRLHPARLNFGDCFAYALATELTVPLLLVGNDFAATDAEPALT